MLETNWLINDTEGDYAGRINRAFYEAVEDGCGGSIRYRMGDFFNINFPRLGIAWFGIGTLRFEFPQSLPEEYWIINKQTFYNYVV